MPKQLQAAYGFVRNQLVNVWTIAIVLIASTQLTIGFENGRLGFSGTWMQDLFARVASDEKAPALSHSAKIRSKCGRR